MSDHHIESIIQVPIQDSSSINNLNSKVESTEYINPVLTLSDGDEYRYRFVKAVKEQRSELLNSDTRNIAHDIPYQFIIGTLKYLVHSIDAQRDDSERGWCPQTLLLADSKERSYAIAILVVMRDFLVTVLSAERVPISEFQSKKLKSYALERKLFFKDLDLDAYLEMTKEKKREKRQNIAKKYPSFWENKITGRAYRFSCTRHLNEERSNTSGQRLTIPIEAVKDILRYAMETSEFVLKEYIGNSEKEKQLVLVFPSLDKSYNVGILIALDDTLLTVISMYDVSPQDKGLNTLIFPNVKRIILADYDLADYMETYHAKKEEEVVMKKKMLRQQLELARKEGNGIKIFASLEEYDAVHPVKKRVQSGKTSRRLRKITKIKVVQPLEQGKEQSIRLKEKQQQSILLGIGAQMMKVNTRKHEKHRGKRKKKRKC